jgi:hypothetical protein
MKADTQEFGSYYASEKKITIVSAYIKLHEPASITKMGQMDQSWAKFGPNLAKIGQKEPNWIGVPNFKHYLPVKHGQMGHPGHA